MRASTIGLYHRLPYWARCAAATVQGWRLRRLRFGGAYAAETAASAERDRWPIERLLQYQSEELARTLRRALCDVPWYRSNVAIDPYAITPDTAFEALGHFPILEKSSIRSAPRQFVSDRFSIHDLIEKQTSGTTGTPLRHWWSRRMMQRWYALFHQRWLGWAGVGPLDRWAILGGQTVVSPERTRPPYWVQNWAMHQCYFSVYHISPDTVRTYLQALRRFRPRYILGYASALDSLATLGHESGETWDEPFPEVAISNAEPFYDWQRDRVEAFFGCRSVDTYGSSEGVFMGVECEHRRIHLCPDVGVWEVLDRDDRPVAPGQPGELVCTGLLNDAMPLIRYRTGDSVTMSAGPCACGHSFPVLDAVEGRSDDTVVMPDGRRIGRLCLVFKADMPIREAQIVQTTPTQLRVSVVPAEGFDAEAANKLRRSIVGHIGSGLEIDIVAVESIPRTRAGKFRAVVNQVLADEFCR